ncbi:alpha/beta fold hydrolase [Streptomyces olivoreticuli]|uniref:alpha/beta fold hydrolase n=1 Tax=Streptomyces olivoreticuli TaxID=68246 RepID=UPI0026595F4A|nr:alpha/beta fold hydrolase [Streptomyces olivoreticuli]WKK26333.1 alpha/beta fold hydrolase [Streptomyces olivoreticuli]
MTELPISLSATVRGSGPGVLLAHGAGGSIAGNFTTLIPSLVAHHTVVAADFPGSGATPRADVLTADLMADALVAQADAAGLDTFTVIGYSMGTLVSVRLAARHPERVRGLVLTAGLAKADNRVLASLDLWQKLLAAGDLEAFARFTALSGFSPGFFNAMPEDQLPSFYNLLIKGVPAGAAEQAAVVQTTDTTGDLAGISVPTLVIAPLQDSLVPPGNSRVLADGIPGAEYAELDTGHIVMAERPEQWSRLIVDFLSRHGL